MLTTPLQVAQAMAAIGNGGTRYQTRLVQQVQTIDSQIVTAYDVRMREKLDIDPKILAEIKKAMVAVVSSGNGTAGRAQVDDVAVAGKTGTAQWGPKSKERAAAWFAGFVPAEKPQYAFAAVYEGDVGSKAHGGSAAAPMIAMVLKDVYKENGNKKKRPETDDTRVRKAQPVEEDEGD